MLYTFHMNTGQAKVRILMLKLLDWVVFISIVSASIYFIQHSDNSELVALAVLLGLLVVNKLGDFTKQRIARLTVDMEIEQKRHKRI